MSNTQEDELKSSNVCQFCNKNYSSKSNLKAHQLRTKKCIDARTNAILIKELISKTSNGELLITKTPTKTSRSLLDVRSDSSTTILKSMVSEEDAEDEEISFSRRDFEKVISQLNTVMAINNKMFCQMLDMSKQITNLSITLENRS